MHVTGAEIEETMFVRRQKRRQGKQMTPEDKALDIKERIVLIKNLVEELRSKMPSRTEVFKAAGLSLL